MCRKLVAQLLMIVCPIAHPLYGREWTDTTGTHSIEAELISCNVVLRLPTGGTKTIDLDKLSQNDREYVADVLARNNSDTSSAANGKGKNKAADRATPNASSKAQQVPIDTLLLAEEREWQDVSRAISPAQGFYSFEYQTSDAAEGFHHYQKSLKSLSELSPQEKRVASVFAERLVQLRNAPSPNDRAKAALRLSGAIEVADQTVPALLQTLEKDVSSEVQLAAAVSLAGFGATAKPAIPTLVKRIDSGDGAGIYLFALAKIGGDSPQLRKIVKKTIDEYRSPNDHHKSSFHRVMQNIVLLGQNSNWAVNPLLQNAEMAIKRDDEDGLKSITDALISIASGDARVLRFYETQAKDGPVQHRVYCDSIAKQLRLKVK